jgi:hypothetical protein
MRTSRRLFAAAIISLLGAGACANPTTLPVSDSQAQYSTQGSGKETVAVPLSGATTTTNDSTSTGTGRGPGVGSGH